MASRNVKSAVTSTVDKRCEVTAEGLSLEMRFMGASVCLHSLEFSFAIMCTVLFLSLQ